jgi:hypothetical protein
MPPVDPNVLATRVAAALKKASAESLEPYWLTLCADSAEVANNEVGGALLRRGLTPDQAAQAPAVVQRAYDLALMEALVRGAGLQDVDPLLLRELRAKRDDLVKAADAMPAPTAAGDFQEVKAGRERIRHGVLGNRSLDAFWDWDAGKFRRW